jgi:small conductance mechanosensitive channel
MVFGIGYDDDIDKARQVIADILSADDRVLKDPAPQIAVSELADSSVNFAVRPWVKTGDYWGVFFDTTETVKKRFDAEGISIPYPQSDVHIHPQATDG